MLLRTRRRSRFLLPTPHPTLPHEGGGSSVAARLVLDPGLRSDPGSALADGWVEQVRERRVQHRRVRARRLGARRLVRIFFRMLGRIAPFWRARPVRAFRHGPNMGRVYQSGKW